VYIKSFYYFYSSNFKNQRMKTKFFLLVIFFLGIGAISYAQTQTAAPAEKKDAPAQVVTPEQGKTTECAGHQAGAKAECKWVDADKDGKCDTCGKTEKECKDACKPADQKSGCPMQKECGKSGASCCPSKDGKK
jgi:hypothetical protein